MGKLLVVGIGPGNGSGFTEQARQAIEQAEIIYGYTTYVELVQPLWPHKRYVATGMRGEIERCQLALQAAAQQVTTRQTVALVCSGDAGIFGLAGLVYELAQEMFGTELPLEIEVVPGVTAAISGAALLGAPLSGDFAVISLSDLLVPWELIEKRLRGAAMGDFVTVLYNPGSNSRTKHLSRACDILLQERSADTVCGLTRNIGRQGQQAVLLTLAQLRDTTVDMFTTVFIGNSATRLLNGKMVTSRGYGVEQ